MGLAVIVPALDPQEKFIDIIKGLSPSEDKPVIVVDDGTKLELLYIFDEISEIPHCVVLHHEVNKGKGRALKTAFAYFREHYLYLEGVITADCDGQHSLKDIIKVGEAVYENEGCIVLGVRDFSGKDVPFKSRFGNNLTAFVFKAILQNLTHTS